MVRDVTLCFSLAALRLGAMSAAHRHAPCVRGVRTRMGSACYGLPLTGRSYRAKERAPAGNINLCEEVCVHGADGLDDWLLMGTLRLHRGQDGQDNVRDDADICAGVFEHCQPKRVASAASATPASAASMAQQDRRDNQGTRRPHCARIDLSRNQGS